MSVHVLTADGLRFAYRNGGEVLDGVSLTVPAGRLVCILGPNGSGKTTLLRCLLGQLRPQQGTILLDGRDIGTYGPKPLAKMLAYVPQFPQSAFAFTVREIVMMGRYAHGGVLGLASAEDATVTRLALQMTETSHFADRTLEELSGGEAQRVMIARALAQQPQVCLLDEPTSHLDIRNQLLIHRMMQRLAHEWEMAVVCVSHEINLAARFADELVLMRDGKVIAGGPPADVIRRDVLEQTYDVEIDLVPLADSPMPLVQPK